MESQVNEVTKEMLRARAVIIEIESAVSLDEVRKLARAFIDSNNIWQLEMIKMALEENE